jgi:hypothetical protein
VEDHRLRSIATGTGDIASRQKSLCAAFLATLILMPLTVACSPTIKVEAPDKPIVINLNVKIEQEVRVKADKDVENMVKSDPNVF